MATTNPYDVEEAEDFLDKVDDVSKRIQDILDGNTDVMEEEKRFQEEAKLRELKQEIRERETQERISKGVKGKGYKGDFKTFCLGCHTEYHHAAVENCNNCGKETVTHEVGSEVVD